MKPSDVSISFVDIIKKSINLLKQNPILLTPQLFSFFIQNIFTNFYIKNKLDMNITFIELFEQFGHIFVAMILIQVLFFIVLIAIVKQKVTIPLMSSEPREILSNIFFSVNKILVGILLAFGSIMLLLIILSMITSFLPFFAPILGIFTFLLVIFGVLTIHFFIIDHVLFQCGVLSTFRQVFTRFKLYLLLFFRWGMLYFSYIVLSSYLMILAQEIAGSGLVVFVGAVEACLGTLMIIVSVIFYNLLFLSSHINTSEA